MPRVFSARARKIMLPRTPAFARSICTLTSSKLLSATRRRVLPDPHAEYSQRLAARQQTAAAKEALHQRIGNAKLATVIVAIVFLWLSLKDEVISTYWLVRRTLPQSQTRLRRRPRHLRHRLPLRIALDRAPPDGRRAPRSMAHRC